MPRVSKLEQPSNSIKLEIPQNSAPQPLAEQPAEEKSPTWFWDMINELPEPEWGKVYDLQLHRAGSSKVPIAEGFKGYLDTFFSPVSLSFIKQKFGGGKYRIILEKNSRFKTSHDFEIEGQPTYAQHERPSNAPAPVASGGDAGTAKLLQEFVGVLRDELARSREVNSASNPATDEAIKILGSASAKAMELVVAQVPRATSAASEMREMIGAMKEMGIIAAPQTAPQKTLMEQLLELIANPIVAPFVSKLLTPTDPLEQLTKMGALAELLDKFRGDGGAPRDWKAILTEKGLEQLPVILQELRDGRSANVKVAQERRAAAEANRQAAETVAKLPARAAAHAPAQATPAPVAPAPTPIDAPPLRSVAMAGEEPQQVAPVAGNEISEEQYDAKVKEHVVEMLVLGASPETIVDYLFDVKPSICEDIKRNNNAVVTAFFNADPILAQITTLPDWNKLLDDARAYIVESDKQVDSDKEEEAERLN